MHFVEVTFQVNNKIERKKVNLWNQKSIVWNWQAENCR